MPALMQLLLAGLFTIALTGAAPAGTGFDGAYDPANPFARILRGELPASKVYEDRHVLAFMPLRQVSHGHVLVISKRPARNILDIDPNDLSRLMRVAQRVARAQAAAFHPDGIMIRQNNGAEAGQMVFHLHVHVVPRYKGVPLAPGEEGPADARAELDAVAATLRAAMRR